MRNNVLATLLSSLALMPAPTVGAVVPTAPTEIPLLSLLGSTNILTSGPFTFDHFSLQVRIADAWQVGPSSLAAALAVRPITGGIELAGTPPATGLMATYSAVAIDYQLVNSSTKICSATTTLFAWAYDASAAVKNQVVVASPSSSDAPSQADTDWSGASPTAGTASIQFLPSTALAVIDMTTVLPGGASTLSYAVDTVFLPEPRESAAWAAGCFLCRRRRSSCEASARVL